MVKNLKNILPYLESEDLYELTQEVLKGNVNLDINEIIPFMDEKDVDKICSDLAENPQLTEKINLRNFYPFASEEYVGKLFLAQARLGIIDNEMLPFVDGKTLHEFVLLYIENPDMEIDIDEVYPFLNAKDVSLLFKTYLKNSRKNADSEE